VALVVGRVHDFQSLDEEVSRVAKDGLNEIKSKIPKKISKSLMRNPPQSRSPRSAARRVVNQT
jgi:hypothetical protein